jgi:Ohr subfamily peroxiredoxin
MLDVELRVPTSMGGPGGATNPEQLFAAGYAACFHSALKSVAARQKLDVTGSEVSAVVGIGKLDTGGFGLAVELDVHAPTLDRSVAETLVTKAHAVCPYSNATRNNIDVTLRVV